MRGKKKKVLFDVSSKYRLQFGLLSEFLIINEKLVEQDEKILMNDW